MRLLNTKTLQLELFFADNPPYVILSHTWGTNEVTFDDIALPHAKSMTGYNKISRCCQQAVLDGFDWVWIDTCCIDKRSSAELSEAINSMYRWYWDAEICYAYLADVIDLDVSDSKADKVLGRGFRQARWFERGWTLQELLAPVVVEFFNMDWVRIGTKSSQVEAIRIVTGIDAKYLRDRTTTKDASIATKFSWAARRQTTRTEDAAYCLLGLMDINMPMLYGEGPKAFYRLQEELLKKTNEHTIFAWEPGEMPWNMLRRDAGMLCGTPAGFDHRLDIRPTPPLGSWSSHELTNNGLRITLPCLKRSKGRLLAILNCRSRMGGYVGILLESVGQGQYRRIADARLSFVNQEKVEEAREMDLYIRASYSHADDVFRTAPNRNFYLKVVRIDPGSSGYQLEGLFEAIPGEEETMTSADLVTEKGLEIEDDEMRYLLFRNGSAGLLVAFGKWHGQLWLKVVQGTFASVEQDVPQEIIEAVERGTNMWSFTRDHLVEELADGLTATISAKRKCYGTDVWWELAVDFTPETAS